MNWRPMVSTNHGRSFAGNGLVFATEQEAKDSADELMWRWHAVTDTKAEETDQPVNYKFVDGQNVRIDETK